MTTTSAAPAPPVCSVCGASRFHPTIFGGLRFQGQTFDRLECDRCGFIFVNPIPDAATFEAMYADSYFDGYYAGGDEVGYDGSADAVRRKAAAILDRLKPYQPTGALLDVGCAGGHFLGEAKRRGYATLGIEVNAAMAQQARDEYGVDVIVGTYESADLESSGRRFDVVYMGDALEHLPDPRQALARLSRLLTPNGVFLLNGPLTLNTSLFTIVLRLKLWLSKGRRAWYADGAPYHLSEWNATTQRLFLVNCGFDVLEFGTHEEPGRPAAVIAAALKRPLTPAEQFARRLKSLSAWTTNAFFKPFGWGDRVIAVARLAPSTRRAE